jgi:hypothetical protein
LHIHRELVAAAGDGRNAAGLVSQSLAQCEDVLGEVTLLDKGLRPDRLQQLFFGNHTSEVCDSSYHVFITPNGDSKSLYVISKTPTTFEVRESGGGTSSLSFDYRIVGKRRGFEAQRLVDVTERFNAERKANTLTRNSNPRHKPAPLTKSPLMVGLNQHPHTLVPRRMPVPTRPPAPPTTAAPHK